MTTPRRRSSNVSSDGKETGSSSQQPTPSPIVELKDVVPQESEREEFAAKAVFTSEPLPEKLQFEGIETFLVPLPGIGYVDEKYFNRKILSQTILTFGLLEKTENELLALLQKTREQITTAYSKRLQPYIQTKSTENARLWRQRVIIVWKQAKYQKKVNLSKLDLIYHNLKLVKKMKSICKELIHRPRKITFNHNSIIRLPTIIKTEAEVKYTVRLKALDYAIADNKIAMKFMPRLFSSPETVATVLNNLLQTATNCVDPLTNYLPPMIEQTTFDDLIQSRFSPIRYCEKQPDSIQNLIELTVEMLKSFAGIKSNNQIFALNAMASRYWFNRMLVSNDFHKNANPKFAVFVDSFKLQKIGNFKYPKPLNKYLKSRSDLSVFEFFKDEPTLKLAIDSLFELIFYTSPVDIAFQLHVIDLRLSGFVGNIIGKDINHKNTVDCLSFMWKLLIIASSLPCPDTLFEFVIQFAEIAFIPTPILKKCSTPIEIIRSLKTEMQKSKF